MSMGPVINYYITLTSSETLKHTGDRKGLIRSLWLLKEILEFVTLSITGEKIK